MMKPPDGSNPVEKEIILEVEEAYADEFEVWLKHWLSAVSFSTTYIPSMELIV